MKFEIKNRSGETLFVADIKCPDDAPKSFKTRLAIEKAIGSGVSLSGADLTDAYLIGAKLIGANLAGADLSGADLTDAYLISANLAGADLTRAGLVRANLTCANLTCADLTRVNLGYANLTNANLTGADLTGADLTDIIGDELTIAKTRILPEGDIIGWKKCKDGVLVKLRIPTNAKRSHAFGRKCRAEFADVLEVIGAEVGISEHDGITQYRAGQRVFPDRFNENWQNECAPGIHFFITRAEAENY